MSFLQIHTLTSYPGVLLNRDDAGFAKRLPFGGASRTRVSSQCLKRHWRTHFGEASLQELGLPRSVRSRRTFEDKVAKPLYEQGRPKALTDVVLKEFIETVVGKTSDEEGHELRTNQITVLGEPEVMFVKAECDKLMSRLLDEDSSLGGEVLSKEQQKSVKEALKELFDKEFKANLKGLKLGAGLDAAVFGRMVTSDLLSRGDAAVHVAHAFTVHAEESESEYFAAIDDLVAETGELGSGMIGSTELNSGLYYGYVVVDVPLLVSNLTGAKREEWRDSDRDDAAQIVGNLIRLIATVSPGAKLGSTAPYSYAQFVGLEWGQHQPRTLANAFQSPVRGNSLLESSYQAIGDFLGDMDGMYGKHFERVFAGAGPVSELTPVFGEQQPIDNIVNWAKSKITEA